MQSSHSDKAPKANSATSVPVQDVLPAAIFLNDARCQVLLDNNLNTPIKMTGTSTETLGPVSTPNGLDTAPGSRRKVLQTGGRIQAVGGQLYGVDGLPLTINVRPQTRALFCDFLDHQLRLPCCTPEGRTRLGGGSEDRNVRQKLEKRWQHFRQKDDALECLMRA